MNRIHVSTAALLALGLVGVTACDHTNVNSADFQAADTNHDGVLNSEEHQRLKAIQAAGGNAAAAQQVKSNLRTN